MPRQKLNETLTTLHAQLQAGTQLDEADRTHLAEVLGDIKQVLESDDAKPHPSLGDRLSETVNRLEAEHPTIAVGLLEALAILKRL